MAKTTIKQLEQKLSVNTSLLRRFALMTGVTHKGKRDMYEVLGYNKSPTIEDYMAKYLRQDITQRIIDALPNAIWTDDIGIQTSSDDVGESVFDKSFDALSKRLRLFSYLSRLDKLSLLGHYAVLLIGVKGGSDLSKEVGKLASIDDIIYLMPFGEVNARITQYDIDPSSERHGLPLMYSLTTGGYGGENSSSMSSSTLTVHHSRVLHVSDGLLDNEVFGVPKLQAIYNRLDDLEKVVGGSAEIYWLNSRAGLNINADKETDIQNPEKLQDHVEEYVHQLSRVLRTKGMDVKTLELGVHNPDKHVSVIIDLIAGATGIPKRILTGSERGELASGQDEKNWLSRVSERRVNYCEPFVLRRFVDKLISWGVLEDIDYDITWSTLVSMSETEKADIATKKAKAIADYNKGNGASLLPPKQFVEEVLKMDFKENDVEAPEDNTEEGDMEAEQDGEI